MRSVNSAIWTSALPVSWGVSPNLAISSCLRSWVSVMRRLRLAEQLPGLRDVAVHLLDQLLHRAEALLAAQAGDELDGDRLAVQVEVAVDQMDLDQHRPPGAERGAHADADGGDRVAHAGGVDPVARAHQRVVRHDVGGREVERAAALVAADDDAADEER